MQAWQQPEPLGAIGAAVQQRLDRYAALLLRWNATLNLIAPRDTGALWQRHILDSLQLVRLIPPEATHGIDLGSGGGFPGLVLSIATGLPFDLIESDRRKAAFLRSAAAETGAPVTVHACRIEDASPAPSGLVTARALAPLPKLLPLAARFLTEDGTGLLLKGRNAEAEVTAARRDWHMDVGRVPSVTSADSVILVVSRLSRAGG